MNDEAANSGSVTPSPHSSVGFGDGVVLSGLTGIAYLIVYSNDVGRALFYGVPLQYVAVDTSQLIATAVILLFIVGLPCTMAIHYRTWDIEAASSNNARAVVGSVTLLISVGCLCYLTHLFPWRWLLAGGALGFCLYGFVLWRIYRSRRARDNAENLKQTLETIKQLADAPRGARVTAVFLALNFAILSVAVAAALGYRSGQSQELYQVLQNGPYKDYAVVWSANADILIVQRLNRRTKTLGYDAAVIKVDKDQSVNWHIVRTGAVDDVYSLWRYSRGNALFP